MNKKRNKKIGQIFIYWPLIFIIPFGLITGLSYIYSVTLALNLTGIVIIYTSVAIYIYVRRNVYTKGLLSTSIIASGNIQRSILDNMVMPYALFTKTGEILWNNIAFDNLMLSCKDKDSLGAEEILNFIQENILNDEDKFGDTCIELRYNLNNKNFRIKLFRLEVEIKEVQYLYSAYIFDDTELEYLAKENLDQQLTQAILYIDNLDEVLSELDDVRKALLTSLVRRRITRYFSKINGITQPFEKDRYYILFQRRHLNKLQSLKFDILEEVKSVNVGNSVPLTLSIGVSDPSMPYKDGYETALAAVELALARGGDQAVVKLNKKDYYYGGRSKTVEKNTRVRARVKAQALRSVIEQKEKILVMGHRLPDIDCVGAGLGVYAICQIMEKKAHIVIEEIINSVKPSVDKFINNEAYPEDMFITPDKAKEIVDKDTLLIIVDVNKPEYTEAPELINRAGEVVVIDHHRQGSSVVKNSILSYVEPYASSTCEMITDILQYISERKIKLDKDIIDALYSGILIDTNYFSNKVGTRTFEAAAYLRKNGADIYAIKKRLREDEQRFRKKAKVLSEAEFFRDGYILGVLDGNDLISPTELGAQAANELLNIGGVKASFVFTLIGDLIFISARSIDEVNVQIIMERLGGGGHQTVAGAQFKGESVNDVQEMLVELVNKMIDEGDI